MSRTSGEQLDGVPLAEVQVLGVRGLVGVQGHQLDLFLDLKTIKNHRMIETFDKDLNPGCRRNRSTSLVWHHRVRRPPAARLHRSFSAASPSISWSPPASELKSSQTKINPFLNQTSCLNNKRTLSWWKMTAGSASCWFSPPGPRKETQVGPGPWN